MMSASSSQNNRREEGCGKWLTKKGKSTMKQLHYKPSLTRTMKPIVFEGKTKSCKMKQSTMSQFLVEETSRKTTRNEINSNDRTTSRNRIPGVLPLKRGVSSEPTKYEDLCGSDSDENDACQTEDSVQKTSQGEKEHIFKDPPTIYCKDGQIENSFQSNYVWKNLDQKGTEKLFPSPKRLKKSRENMDPGARLGSNSAGNEVDFTEWFENDIDAFIQHNNEDNNALNEQNLLSKSCRYSSSCKPSDSEEELPQFSEWFNHHIQKINHKELPVNILQSRARDVSQHNSTFTQWLEANLENIKSPS